MVLLMAGFDRAHLPTRSTRKWASETLLAAGPPSPELSLLSRVSAGQSTAWDLLSLSRTAPEATASWADRTLESIVASAVRRYADSLECEDCEDVGFYGEADLADADKLVTLVRRRDAGSYEQLTASGHWRPYTGRPDNPLEVLDRETAGDLAEAITAGASGLVRRFFWPQAFLPPETMLAAVASPQELTAPKRPDVDPAQAADAADDGGWKVYALVDDLDPGAVLSLIRLRPGPELTAYTAGGVWADDTSILTKLTGPQPPPLVELESTQITAVIQQIEGTGAEPGATTAAAVPLVADAPLTVSPDPRAEKLRRYWTTGKGAAKIRWGTPGDWTRCYRQLRKHMGVRAKGYCQNLHKRATGSWTGSRLNASAARTNRPGQPAYDVPMEVALVAAVSTGSWMGPGDGGGMTLTDGVYAEAGSNQGLLRALTAGGFPVAPPDDWFANPELEAPTPLTVDDDGRVYGHIATRDVAHIGLPGKVHAPKSRSNYAYFKTGELVTASGARVQVGQLTLAGGHASMQADASAAVAHYDQTGSACADLNIGDDQFGIWVAGALRPEVTPAQLRTLRASAPSGDWRPINGRLELVACCQVNVPGFPVVRATVASGAITALVAAGAPALYGQRLALLADAALQARVTELEAHVFGLADADSLVEAAVAPGVQADSPSDIVVADGAPVEVAPIEVTDADPVAELVEGDPVAETPAAPEVVVPPVDEVAAEQVVVPDAVARARELVAQRKAAKRDELRARVYGASGKPEAQVAASGAGQGNG